MSEKYNREKDSTVCTECGGTGEKDVNDHTFVGGFFGMIKRGVEKCEGCRGHGTTKGPRQK